MRLRSRKVWSRWWELVQEKLLEFAPTVGVPKRLVQQSVGRWRFFPPRNVNHLSHCKVHQEPWLRWTLGASCFPKFMEQWPSFLRRHCCFALFCMFPHHFARRPNPNPPKQAVDNCLACSNLLFSIRWSPGTVLLLEPPLLWQTGSSADGKKKQQQNNKATKTAFGAPKGVENPRSTVSYWMMITLLANTLSSKLCVKILTFLPSDFLWFCRAMIRIDAMTCWLDWDSLVLGSAKGFVPLVKILMLWITCHVFIFEMSKDHKKVKQKRSMS